jgi:hypothetical protein
MAKDKISKMGAVRQALETLGADAKPLAIQDYVKKEHGIEMSTNMISNYKTHLAKRGKRRGRKPGRKPALATSAPERRGSISMADIEAVKALTQRLGADKVRDLAAVLAK